MTREPTKPDGSRRLPATVWLLSWVSLLADISGEMMYPLLPLFLVGVLGASKIQVGAIEGLALLMVALMSAYAATRAVFNRDYYFDGQAEFTRCRGTSATSGSILRGDPY
ncbi:MAG: hypothetical protein ACK48X_02625, partial [Planctomycetota bacterium]